MQDAEAQNSAYRLTSPETRRMISSNSVPDRIHLHAWLAAALLALAGCATVPPPVDALAGAESAIRMARDAGAEDHAPLELRFARDRLEEAQDAMVQRQHARAGDLAEEAQADAELARAKAELAAQRQRNDAQRDDNERLRQSLLEPDAAAGGAP